MPKNRDNIAQADQYIKTYIENYNKSLHPEEKKVQLPEEKISREQKLSKDLHDSKLATLTFIPYPGSDLAVIFNISNRIKTILHQRHWTTKEDLDFEKAYRAKHDPTYNSQRSKINTFLARPEEERFGYAYQERAKDDPIYARESKEATERLADLAEKRAQIKKGSEEDKKQSDIIFTEDKSSSPEKRIIDERAVSEDTHKVEDDVKIAIPSIEDKLPSTETKDVYAGDLQTHLYFQTRKIHEHTLNFTYQIVKKLIDDYPFLNPKIPLESTFNQFGKYSTFMKNHKIFVETLRTYIKPLLEQLTTDRINDKKLHLTQKEEKFYNNKSKDYLLELASRLNGIYIPSRQGFDPLSNTHGFCAGHVLRWAKEIHEKGYSRSLQKVDTSTDYYQTNQTHLKPKSIKNEIFINHPESILLKLDEFFGQLNERNIYYLRIAQTNELASSHACGFRIIPPTHKIEFTDPNCVAPIVFDNIDEFKKWFCHLLKQYYSIFNEMSLASSIISAQPSVTEASIPLNDPKLAYETEILQTSSNLEFFPPRNLSRGDFEHAKFIKDIRQKSPLILAIDGLTINETTRENFYSSLEIVSEKFDVVDYVEAKGDKNKDIQNNFDTANKEMKNKVIKLIEIKKQLSLNSPKKLALTRLQKMIWDAAPYLTLESIVEYWLYQKSDDNQYYKDIIKKQGFFDHDTPAFIATLVTENEINPLCAKEKIDELQSKILLQLHKMIHMRDWGKVMPFFPTGKKRNINQINPSLPDVKSVRLPKSVANITDILSRSIKITDTTFTNYERLTNVLNNIKDQCKKSNHVFSRLFNWRTRETAIFQDILKNLDVENTSSLMTVRAQLLDYDKRYLQRSTGARVFTTTVDAVLPLVSGCFAGAVGYIVTGAIAGSVFPGIGTVVGCVLGAIIAAFVLRGLHKFHDNEPISIEQPANSTISTYKRKTPDKINDKKYTHNAKKTKICNMKATLHSPRLFGMGNTSKPEKQKHQTSSSTVQHPVPETNPLGTRIHKKM